MRFLLTLGLLVAGCSPYTDDVQCDLGYQDAQDYFDTFGCDGWYEEVGGACIQEGELGYTGDRTACCGGLLANELCPN